MTTAATVEIIGESNVGDVVAHDLARARASLAELESVGSQAAQASLQTNQQAGLAGAGLPSIADQIVGALQGALDQLNALPGAHIKLVNDDALNAIREVAAGLLMLAETLFPPVKIAANDADVLLKAAEVEARLAKIQDKTVTITVNVVQVGSVDIPGATTTPPGNAAGTLSSPGGLTLVGERGPELVSLPSGAGVWDALDTRRMLDTLGKGGGDTVISGPVYITAPTGATLADLLRQARQARAA